MDEAQRASMVRIITRKLLEERCGVPPTVDEVDPLERRQRDNDKYGSILGLYSGE